MEAYGITLLVVVILAFIAAGLLVGITYFKRRPTFQLEGFRCRGPHLEGLAPVLGKVRHWGQNYLPLTAFSQLMRIQIAFVDASKIPNYRGRKAFETGKREMVGFTAPYVLYVPSDNSAKELLCHAFGHHILLGLQGRGFDVDHQDKTRQDMVRFLAGVS